MNIEYKNGFIRTTGDVICLLDADKMYVNGLYNWKTNKHPETVNIIMPKEFYMPVLIDRPTRYLMHNNDLILTLV